MRRIRGPASTSPTKNNLKSSLFIPARFGGECRWQRFWHAGRWGRFLGTVAESGHAGSAEAGFTGHQFEHGYGANQVAEAVEKLQDAIRTEHPEVKRIFIEAKNLVGRS